MTPYRCIWCTSLTTRPSREHLLQAALGGRAMRDDIACAECNNAFTHQSAGAIDTVIARQFELFRNALRVRSRRGSPPTMRTAERVDGLAMDLGPGLTAEPRKARREEVVLPDGSTQIQITAASREEARKLVEHVRAVHGDDAKLATAIRRVPVRGEIPLSVVIGGPEGLRAVAKTAFNVAAAALPREVILRPQFNAARRHVRYGEGPSVFYPDFENAFPARSRLGDFDHAVQVVCDPVARTVRAYVTLFGGILFSGVLAREVDLPSATLWLVQDPVTGRSDRGRMDTVPPEEFEARLPTSWKRDFGRAAPLLTAAIQRVLEATYDAARESRAAELTENLLGALERCTTDDERNAAIRAFSEKLALEMLEIPIEEPLPLDVFE